MIYISVFGQWKPSMQTLSFVMVAAPISFLLGLFLGIWAYRNKWIETILNPVLNVMQTMPHYAYLVPITVLVFKKPLASPETLIVSLVPSRALIVYSAKHFFAACIAAPNCRHFSILTKYTYEPR